VDVRLYSNTPPASRTTKVDTHAETRVDLPAVPDSAGPTAGANPAELAERGEGEGAK
jgi:hypothetical protein